LIFTLIYYALDLSFKELIKDFRLFIYNNLAFICDDKFLYFGRFCLMVKSLWRKAVSCDNVLTDLEGLILEFLIEWMIHNLCLF